jgi:hypothetical protein
VSTTLELNEKQKALIEWLLDPSKDKGSLEQWGEDNGVARRTVFNWKRHRLFREEWEKRAYEVYGGPERVNAVVDSLYKKAVVDGEVRAMQLYLQYVDKFTPKREVVNTTRGLEELSDEELASLGDNITTLRTRKSS